MGKDHWNEHAKRWSHVGQPLRPSAEDVTLVEDYLSQAFAPEVEIQALMLGVTPELAGMKWPESARLLAVDKNQAMIDGVWPEEDVPENAKAVYGDWLCLPCEKHSVDFAVGDGCLTLLSYNEHYPQFFSEVNRVLKPGGGFIIRHFVRPEQKERVEDVFRDLIAGSIGNFHILKWRLAMALHGSIEEGVCVGDIWRAWDESDIDKSFLIDNLCWSEDSINTIDNYRDAEARYTFPTLAEVNSVADQFFDTVRVETPGYELGERCPTFFLTSKG